MSDGTLVQEDGLKSFEPQRLFPMFLACPQELIFGEWIAMMRTMRCLVVDLGDLISLREMPRGV